MDRGSERGGQGEISLAIGELFLALRPLTHAHAPA
jgi:hypothetical protein